ncbi:cell surface protein [Methanosarcina siciliae T4/M]|uniref:Cell surface protein n=1 Tax=Methanosarcina siciliae T4/M TaxID=1434120 RepID=A0A0E3P8J9_9EURY|nr:PQQ-binding-like beta-propeller repeat protein [Methanosarcina siciliae]AKB30307.1 cell surface protein [Methanosarcina siciliae T4/M]
MNLNVKIKFIPVILLFLSILLFSSTTIASNNTDTWSQFHKDVANTGFSSGEAPDTGKLLWVSDPIWAIPSSSPVIAEGKVFVKCGVDQVNSMSTTPEELRIVTIDEYTGNIISSDEIGPVTPCWSSLCYDNGKIWYGRADALNGGPMVADGKVFDSDGESHHYYCTDAETEEELWNFTVTGVAIGTPAYYEGKVYLTSGPLFSSPGHVYCVNAENGDELWNQTLPYEAGGSPAVSEGVVYATTYDGNLYALDAEDGSILWSETVPSTDVSSTPAIAYGNVYISGGCPGISTIETYCFNATTHEMVWNTCGEDKIGGWTASVAVADGMIFVGKYAEDDYFGYAGTYALDAYTGDVVWSYPSGGASPAISDGILFTIGADGRVYAFADPEEVLPSVSIKCNMSDLGFGSLASGERSVVHLNITNAGNSNVTISAEPEEGNTQLYNDSLFLGSNFWNQYSQLISSLNTEEVELVLDVPAGYEGELDQAGECLIFWGEEV